MEHNLFKIIESGCCHKILVRKDNINCTVVKIKRVIYHLYLFKSGNLYIKLNKKMLKTFTITKKIAKQYVYSEKDGDVYAAFDDVMQAIRRDINDKKKEIETAIAFAQYGEKEESILNKINPIGGEGRWAPVRRAIEDIAENPPLKKETLEEIKEKSKKP